MNNKKEYAIGETVQMGLVTLVCVEDEDDMGCKECQFCDIWKSIGCEFISNYFVGNCAKESRTDNKDVIFRLKEK